MQPGQFSKELTYDEWNLIYSGTSGGDSIIIKTMQNDLKALGLTFTPENQVVNESGGYWVVLTVKPGSLDDDSEPDYHWYRYDETDNENGYWSHKPGSTEARVTKVPKNKHDEYVTDPYETAIGVGYYHIVGKFYVSPIKGANEEEELP